MTYSMTAFARQQSVHDWGILAWEIRSVNHRYLETNFKLPESMRHLESNFRDILRKSVSRGKIEAHLKYSPQRTNSANITINKALLTELHQASQQITTVMNDCAQPTSLEVLNWPGLIQIAEHDTREIEAHTLALFKAGINDLIAHREREGDQLRRLIEQRLTKITEIIQTIRTSMPAILTAQKDKLSLHCQNLLVEIDPARLEQEILVLAQKADIDEEVDRLDTHVQEVNQILKQSKPVGRRLDFLMQELNREANTICSKSIVTETTFGAVELKVLIEQMREQIQNIE